MTTPNLTSGTWFSASEGCSVRCYRNSDGDVNLIVGESPQMHELTFDMATFREVISQGNAVLHGMEIREQQEQADAEESSADDEPDTDGSPDARWSV